MKEKELRENCVCILCSKKIGEVCSPFFWRVKIKRYRIKASAVKGQTGLGMIMGPQLAQVMGPDEEMALKILTENVTICDDCSSKKTSLLELIL